MRFSGRSNQGSISKSILPRFTWNVVHKKRYKMHSIHCKKEMETQIDETMNITRQKLLENFDDEVAIS
jgi:Trm5-related predicted tRNA methylase